MPSPSQLLHDGQAPAWLVEQVYAPRRQRTVDLVRSALTALDKRKERISLATLAAATKAADPNGQGVWESAILTNPEAYQGLCGPAYLAGDDPAADHYARFPCARAREA